MTDAASLAARYRTARTASERLCAPLEPDDYLLQSMPDCSPPKWHLAHTTWFFETFVLGPHAPGFRPFHPNFCYLFNSYYEAVGARWPRPARGLLSRPTVPQVYDYRRATDDAVLDLLERADERQLAAMKSLIELGLNHEEQHQELLLTDLKHALALNPLTPVYATEPPTPAAATPLRWESFPAGVRSIGYDGDAFAFDNESPRHRVFLEAFEIASRPSTAGEYAAFIEGGGYERPELWLSDGWAARQREGWHAPLYWDRDGDDWQVFTLHGMRPLDPHEPVCHVSYYEADAFARWAGARLPTETEWETAALARTTADDLLLPIRPHPEAGVSQFFGTVWQWTASPYTAYPGYRPAAGALGEYNGKFMCNQMVLRGSSCATPAGHARPTYRNFFPPHARWQFSGVRLARDLTS